MEHPAKPVDRETLYNEVWTEPVTIVALRYGLSDVGLAKMCRKLSIPIPSRGYWAKVKAGRIMKRVPLPKIARPFSGATPSLAKLPDAELETLKIARKAAAEVRKEALELIEASMPAATEHPLVQATRKRLCRRDGWPANTLLRSAPKDGINVSVTRDSIERALLVVNGLLNALIKQGITCEVDSARGLTLLVQQETGTSLEFALTEHVSRSQHEVTAAEERARKRYWNNARSNASLEYPHIPRYDYTPTGVLTVQVGRWPSKSWKDTPKKSLERRLPEMVVGVMALVHETYAKKQEDARREAAFAQAKDQYEYLMQRRRNEEERFKKVESSADDFDRACRLRALATAYEQRAGAASELSPQQHEWLQWVRAKADWLDPLILVSDPILDAPEPKEPRRW